MYSKRDLNKARRQLRRLQRDVIPQGDEAISKHREELDKAHRVVDEIEWELKTAGRLPTTQVERVQITLNSTNPDANHGDIASLDGFRYQLICRDPDESLPNGQRIKWARHWVPHNAAILQ